MKPIGALIHFLYGFLLAASFNLQAVDSPSTGHALDTEAIRQNDLGRNVYNFHCYFCHGYSGDAQTLAARFLSPPPRDFNTSDPNDLTYQRMQSAVREGRSGTAMKPFTGILSNDEIDAVIEYVRQTFMLRKLRNTRYHSEENGWYNHERFRDSYPFATGEIPLDTPAENLSITQREGLRVYLQSCISCHDRSRVADPVVVWEPIASSYPRIGFRPGDSLLQPDAITGASPFSKHDIAPSIPNLSPAERMGEQLFQSNCAFCHAADGTGRNWIGTFLEPHPRDLTDPDFMVAMSRKRIEGVIREGLPGTSMPAWKSVFDDTQIDAVVRYIHRVFHPLSGMPD